MQYVPIISGVATVDASLGTNAETSTFLIILTANVTSLEITKAKIGQQITIALQQDATGGRTVSFASDVLNGVSPSSGASTVTLQGFAYNEFVNKWYGLSGTAGGGGGSGTQTIASGTAALGTSLIASGAADTVVTVVAAGVLTTDNILADFNADPTGVVGYQPSVNGMLTIIKYPTSGNVNFKVVNNTSAGITPGAITLNWRVVR